MKRTTFAGATPPLARVLANRELAGYPRAARARTHKTGERTAGTRRPSRGRQARTRHDTDRTRKACGEREVPAHDHAHLHVCAAGREVELRKHGRRVQV